MRRELLAERKALHVRPAFELVETGLAAAHNAVERIDEAVALPVVVAVGENDLLRRTALEPIDPFPRNERVDQHLRGLHVVRAHRLPDTRVDPRPVMDAWQNLAHRWTFNQLTQEWSHVSGPAVQHDLPSQRETAPREVKDVHAVRMVVSVGSPSVRSLPRRLGDERRFRASIPQDRTR